MDVAVKNKAFALVALGAVVSASLVFGGSPAVAAACFSSFTNKTTADGLGDDVVNGVYVVGSNVYAATDGGLSISTDGGASFTNKTTSNGLGNNIVWGVYVDGSNVYAATDGGLSISADCASPPTLAETGADPSLVLVGSGLSALLLFVGAAAILASRRKRATD
jgi:LPXTG-motif cell wall-anchored protein